MIDYVYLLFTNFIPMEKVLVTDLWNIVSPIAERVSANTEIADAFGKLSVNKRVKAFDKALHSLWIREFKEFTNHSTWEVTTIQSSDKVIRRLVDVPSPKWNVYWFIKVLADANRQFTRGKTVRSIWKLTADWTIVKLS